MTASSRMPLFLSSSSFQDLRRIFWLVLGIGMAGSLAAVAYLAVLRWCEALLGPEHWPAWGHLGILCGTGLAVALIARWLGSPGDVELLVDNIHVLGGRNGRGELRSLLPISLLCIASGGAAGPEAPLVQTTGALGTRLAEWRKLSLNDKRILTITGMAAGFTALFGAPLGAAIFSLEILHRRGMEYYEALLPALLGSLCGYAVFVLATGTGLDPIWRFPAVAPLRPVDFAWALGAGLAGAVLAAAFEYFNRFLRWCFGKLPALTRPVLGGLLLGLAAMVSPFALTFGETQIETLVNGHPVLALLLLAAAAKFVATSITVSSGWRGGFIIPLFFMGVALARAAHLVFPQTNEVMLIAAMMVALNTGVTKTPLGSTLVVTHMAGLTLLPTTLLAALASLLLSSEFGMIHSQRSRRAENLHEIDGSIDRNGEGPLPAHA